MTSFAERVYAVVKTIPHGRVSTYRDVAHALGTRAYRAVGRALHCNPYAPIVPCHRVVCADGSLGGFASGARNKKKLLLQEGVVVHQNMIDLRRYLCSLKKRGA